MNTVTAPAQLTDQEILNKMVPGWARALNVVYNHTFAHLDRFVDWLSGWETRRLVADFEKSESANSGS